MTHIALVDPEATVEELVVRVTGENVDVEVDTGPTMGSEVW